jgi:hypothetical protein
MVIYLMAVVRSVNPVTARGKIGNNIQPRMESLDSIDHEAASFLLIPAHFRNATIGPSELPDGI